MPSRLLREGILDSEAVNRLSPVEEVFYRRLMSVVDDFGRFDGRPQVLRCRLYPLKVNEVREADISRWIAACEKAGLIALYQHDSKPYILFGKLGSPRNANSKFPPPPPESERLLSSENDSKQLKTVVNNCVQLQTLAPGSYSYSGTGTGTGDDRNGTGGAEIKKKPDSSKFQRFWKQYPRKVGKPKAESAFIKVVTDADFDAVMTGLDRWKRSNDWTKDRGQYIPHPTTFLNQRRWEDSPEIEVMSPPPSPSNVPHDKPIPINTFYPPSEPK